MKRKLIRIIAFLLCLLLLSAFLLPVIVHAGETGKREDSEGAGKIYKRNSDYSTENGERANYGEKTLYDDYSDFDELMREERESRYEHSVKTNYRFVVSQTADEITVSLKHDGKTSDGGLKLFNESGNRVPAEFEYLPGEIVIRLRNAGNGSGYAIQGHIPGHIIGIEQAEGSGNSDEWIKTVEDEFARFGYVSIDDEINRSLGVKDKVNARQLERVLQSYPLIPDGSLLKKKGVAEAFIRVQDEYNVSAIGLLAIGCLESAYGTSRIAREKQNLFGWGAVDSDPFNGAWDWSELDTDEAVYKAVSLIAVNYINGRYMQNSYMKMRYNTVDGVPTHQYCTSRTWIYSNALIRAQLEVFIGLR